MPSIKSNKNFLEIYLKVFSQFVKKEFDIIHFNANPAWINGSSMLLRFAKLTQTPTILNIHGIPQLERIAEKVNDSVSFSDWMPTLIYCNLADRIVVNSEFMRNNVVAWYRVNPQKVVVIPNGVDQKIFTNCDNRMPLDGDPSVLYIGHFSTLKGVDILIQSIAHLKSQFPNIKLHLVGSGNDHYFSLIAKKEGIEKNVVFHGWAKQPVAACYYKSADICVFPSRHEGFGLVVLEAMASGIPIIASDIPSFREIISDGVDGKLFKTEDSGALSKAIVNLSQDPQLRKELSLNAYQKASQYSWENIADKYILLYKSLLNCASINYN